MKEIDIFVERSDGRIWPVPGVYASKKDFENEGFEANVHDTFLNIPDKVIIEYLNKFQYNSYKKIIVFIGGFTYEKVSPLTKQWFKLINNKMKDLKNKIDQIEISIIGFFADFINVKDFFDQADYVYINGYDSFFKFMSDRVKLKTTLDPLKRKNADYLPANGFIWRSKNLMIDMPSLICPVGLCSNCIYDFKTCTTFKKAKEYDLENDFNHLYEEIISTDLPLNLALTGNSLTLSNEKIILTYQMLEKISRRGIFELHLDVNFPQFFSFEQAWKLVEDNNIGSLRLVIPALTRKGLQLYGHSNFDIESSLLKLREIVGRTTFIMVELIIGLPGDTVDVIESKISYLESFVDIINIQVISIHKDSKLLNHSDYKKISENLDMWGNCEWELPDVSRSELAIWLDNYQKEKLNSIINFNYSSFTEVLHASNNRFSSFEIRENLDKLENNKPNWLTSKLFLDRIELNKDYVNAYLEILK